MPMGDNIREEAQAKVDGLRAVNRMLREQNRVLRNALQEIYEGRWTPGVSGCYEDDARSIYPTREMRIRSIAQAALTATSQPEPCTNHFSDGSKIFPSRDCCKPATSQEGKHESR